LQGACAAGNSCRFRFQLVTISGWCVVPCLICYHPAADAVFQFLESKPVGRKRKKKKKDGTASAEVSPRGGGEEAEAGFGGWGEGGDASATDRGEMTEVCGKGPYRGAHRGACISVT
jgi:hypothetical protein